MTFNRNRRRTEDVALSVRDIQEILANLTISSDKVILVGGGTLTDRLVEIDGRLDSLEIRVSANEATICRIEGLAAGVLEHLELINEVEFPPDIPGGPILAHLSLITGLKQ